MLTFILPCPYTRSRKPTPNSSLGMLLNHEGGGPWSICDSGVLRFRLGICSVSAASCLPCVRLPITYCYYLSCALIWPNFLRLCSVAGMLRLLLDYIFVLSTAFLSLFLRLLSDLSCPWLGPLLSFSLPCNGFCRYTLSQCTVLCQGGLSPLQLS